jgi:hypothetical protein
LNGKTKGSDGLVLRERMNEKRGDEIILNEWHRVSEGYACLKEAL